MDRGRRGRPGRPAAQTVYIINAELATTLNHGMEDFTARGGIKPALFALEGCAEEILKKIRLKTPGQKTVSNIRENILQSFNSEM